MGSPVVPLVYMIVATSVDFALDPCLGEAAPESRSSPKEYDLTDLRPARVVLSSSLGSPQYTMSLTVLMLPFDLRRLPSLSADTKTALHSAWLRMYSTAFSPRVSYRGTQAMFARLHACIAIIHSGQLAPKTPTVF